MAVILGTFTPDPSSKKTAGTWFPYEYEGNPLTLTTTINSLPRDSIRTPQLWSSCLTNISRYFV